jgi:hypothetical protein
MDKLIQKLKNLGFATNITQENILKIRWNYSFEPHGRASETWENVWYLNLDCIPVKHLKYPSECVFTGRTFDEVINKALAWLNEKFSGV